MSSCDVSQVPSQRGAAGLWGLVDNFNSGWPLALHIPSTTWLKHSLISAPSSKFHGGMKFGRIGTKVNNALARPLGQ
jgi:hypothetical protein